MVCSITKEKTLKRNNSKGTALVIFLSSFILSLVSIMRNNTNIEIKYNNVEEDNRLDESKEEETPLQQIAKLVERNGQYWIYHKSQLEDNEEEIDKNPESKLWHVVKNCKVHETSKNQQQNSNTPIFGCKLMPNDVIKLGRVRFKVREIVSQAYNRKQQRALKRQKELIKDKENSFDEQIKSVADDINFAPSAVRPGEEDSNRKNINQKATLILRNSSRTSNASGISICRICLSEEEPEQANINPLFSPCKCAGTMKYIHLNCLQEWLNSRMITKESASTKTYFWKNLECELCKSAFPNYVKPPGDNAEEISLHVVNYQKPNFLESEDPAYIVLESITNTSGKVIHVVNMKVALQAKIGRGHDVDVRITDISVSRLHALIKQTHKGYFYLADNRSKFGSLSLIRYPQLLNQSDPNFIQAGRTMLELQIRIPVSILSNCFCGTGMKQKKRVVQSTANTRIGLSSKNGIDYYPEDFLPLKLKLSKKADDHLLINEEVMPDVNQREGNSSQNLEMQNEQIVNQELLDFQATRAVNINNFEIQQMPLIQEEPIEGGNFTQRQIMSAANFQMNHSLNLINRGVDIQLSQQWLRNNNAQTMAPVNDQPVNLNLNVPFSSLVIHHDISKTIHQIEEELENSISRLIEENKSDDAQEQENEDFDQQAFRSFNNDGYLVEELKEFDDRIALNSNLQRKRIDGEDTPPRISQNYFYSPKNSNNKKIEDSPRIGGNSKNFRVMQRELGIREENGTQEDDTWMPGLTLAPQAQSIERNQIHVKNIIRQSRDGQIFIENCSQIPTSRFKGELQQIVPEDSLATSYSGILKGPQLSNLRPKEDLLINSQVINSPNIFNSPNNPHQLTASFIEEERYGHNIGGLHTLSELASPFNYQIAPDKLSSTKNHTYLKQGIQPQKIPAPQRFTQIQSSYKISGGHPITGSNVLRQSVEKEKKQN